MTFIIRKGADVLCSERLVLGSGLNVGQTTDPSVPELLPIFSGARAYCSGDIALPNATWTSIPFSAEDYDVGGYHNTAANQPIFPIQQDGIYLVVAVGVFSNGAESQRSIRIRLNASLVEAETTLHEGGEGVTVVATAVLSVGGGNYLEMAMFQNSGAALVARGGTAKQTSMTVVRLA